MYQKTLIKSEVISKTSHFKVLSNVIIMSFSGLHCLNDVPDTVEWPDYAQPFGVSWTMDEQCRQEFGEGYILCSAVSNHILAYSQPETRLLVNNAILKLQ